MAQLQSAMLWARLAHSSNHPSTLEAYRTCLELSERNLAISPTLDMQHEVVRVEGSLSLDAASYAISQGDLPLAVEMLEQGRALLWSQVRRWRTPLDQLTSDDDLELRTAFFEKSRALETLGTSSNPFAYSSDDMEGPSDLYGTMLATKRRLTSELNDVIERIRRLPGLSEFLKLPSWDRLKSVSAEGPVIVVNHSQYRSDALIIPSNGDIACVELDGAFYEKSIKLSEQLLKFRQTLDFEGGQEKYHNALRRTLQHTWKLVVGPVVETLKTLDVDYGSRIWWCPTSVVSTLPLHAAGPIPLPDRKPTSGEERYLIDLYVSSYTPTLTALIEARSNATLQPARPISLLGVAPLDGTLETAAQEIQILRTHPVFASPERLSLATGDNCSQEAVIAGLRERPWVHFACHGVLEPGEPFNSAFVLSRGQRLTLLDIIKAGLHNAELAVLSACHTAEQTRDSASEEALHLAAAMQFSGFRAVIGTMWQMKDEDGPTFAQHFYDEIFAAYNEDDTIDNPSNVGFKKAARALCSATKAIRKRQVDFNLERWVNFVHIGA